MRDQAKRPGDPGRGKIHGQSSVTGPRFGRMTAAVTSGGRHDRHPGPASMGIGLTAAIVLSGCVTTTPLMRPGEATSLVAYTKRLRADTSAGLDGSLGAALRESGRALESAVRAPAPRKMDSSSHQEINRPDYAAIATWWCPRHKEVANAQQVSNKYGEICTERGGIWRPPYCENGQGDPMFVAVVSASPRYCSSGYPTAVVRVIEPKGALDAANYVAALGVEVGYRTRETIVRDTLRERQKAQQEQQARNLATMKVQIEAQRGTKLCIIDGGITTEAFLLDKTQLDRYEVRIHDVWSYRSSTSTSRPSGGGRFGSIGQVVFVNPEGWRICG